MNSKYSLIVATELIKDTKMSTNHVVSMYVATSGASGQLLGSDEKEVILLVYAVIDTSTNKVSLLKNNSILHYSMQIKIFSIFHSMFQSIRTITASQHINQPTSTPYLLTLAIRLRKNNSLFTAITYNQCVYI